MRFVSFVVLIFFFLPRIVSAQFWAALPPIGPHSAYDISFSHDEKFVFYISSESGVANVYRVPVKGGPAQQVTKFTDAPVVRAMHMLGRNYVVYMRAKTPSDSDYHIYRILDDGTGDILDITPFAAGVRSTIIGASYNGQFIYYTSNKEKASKIDCYRYDNNQNISQLDLPNDKDYRVMAWSRDHARLLVQDPKDEALFFFNIETTDRKLQTTPASGEHYLEALMTPDNHQLIVLKQMSGGMQVVHADVGSTSWSNDEAGDIARVDFSPNGKFRFVQHFNGTIDVSNVATKDNITFSGSPIAIGIAPKESLIAYVVSDAAGARKLMLLNVEKKTSTELATTK